MTINPEFQLDPDDSQAETGVSGGGGSTPVPESVGTRPGNRPAPLRALIVDDADSTRRLLRAILEHSPHFEVVGEAGNGDSAIELAGTLQPDFVLLDLSMPLLDGASALKGLVEAAPNALVIIVSGANPSLGNALLASGATAFVPKGIAPHELLMRLGSILGRWVDSDSPIGWEEIDRKSNGRVPETKLPQCPGNRAVVYDGDPAQRQKVAEAFEQYDVSVIAETDNALTLFTILDLAQPEFIVLDLTMKGEPSAAVLAEVRRRSPRSVVLVYSDAVAWKELALAVGAAAFVLKPQIDELSERISQLVVSQ